MREVQIRAEWRRAAKAQGAADLSLKAGFYEDAVLHAAKAALLARDIVTESHTAVRRLFGKELVQQGLLEKEWALILAHEQDERTSADYDVELTFSQEIAGQRVEQAQRFLKRIFSFLQAEGLDEVSPG